jgi:hypothetical protein
LKTIVVLVLSLGAAAELSLVDDFEGYDEGTTLNGLAAPGRWAVYRDADDTAAYHTLRAGAGREDSGN